MTISCKFSYFCKYLWNILTHAVMNTTLVELSNMSTKWFAFAYIFIFFLNWFVNLWVSITIILRILISKYKFGKSSDNWFHQDTWLSQYSTFFLFSRGMIFGPVRSFARLIILKQEKNMASLKWSKLITATTFKWFCWQYLYHSKCWNWRMSVKTSLLCV